MSMPTSDITMPVLENILEENLQPEGILAKMLRARNK